MHLAMIQVRQTFTIFWFLRPHQNGVKGDGLKALGDLIKALLLVIQISMFIMRVGTNQIRVFNPFSVSVALI